MQAETFVTTQETDEVLECAPSLWAVPMLRRFISHLAEQAVEVKVSLELERSVEVPSASVSSKLSLVCYPIVGAACVAVAGACIDSSFFSKETS